MDPERERRRDELSRAIHKEMREFLIHCGIDVSEDPQEILDTFVQWGRDHPLIREQEDPLHVEAIMQGARDRRKKDPVEVDSSSDDENGDAGFGLGPDGESEGELDGGSEGESAGEYAPMFAMMDAAHRSDTAEADASRYAAFSERLTAVSSKFTDIAAAMFPGEEIELGEAFNQYVGTVGFWPRAVTTRIGWALRRWDRQLHPHFVELAQIITELPATEAIAERFFSVMSYVIHDRREAADLDLIQAEMMIRMWQIFHRDDFRFVAVAGP